MGESDVAGARSPTAAKESAPDGQDRQGREAAAPMDRIDPAAQRHGAQGARPKTARKCDKRKGRARVLARARPSPAQARAGWIIERPNGGGRTNAASGHFNFKTRRQQLLSALVGSAGNIAKTDGGSHGVTITARGEKADDAPVFEHGLVVEQQRLRILEFELQKSPLQSQVAFAEHGCATNELAKATIGLLGLDGKSEARLEDVILIADVVSEMPKRLLEPQRVHGKSAGGPQPHRGAGVKQKRPQRPRELGWDVELETELTHIADAMRPHVRHPDLDVTLGREG